VVLIVPDLLDTNIFVHMIRDDATGKRLKQQRQLLLTEATPAFCMVTDGEIRSLAYQFNWGIDKIEQMRYYLESFRRVPIDTSAVIEAYAVIDSYSKSIGISMGKNDIWIAATAHVTGFELITTDHDFDHLDPSFLTGIRIAIETTI
jgi:predicted nucleic acid-binding protein